MGNPLSTEKTVGKLQRDTFTSHFRDLGEKGAHPVGLPGRLRGTRRTQSGRDSGSGGGVRSTQ